MKDVFTKILLKYSLRNYRVTLLPNPKTTKNGADTIAYKTVQLRITLPAKYKNLAPLDLFKSQAL